MDGLSEEKREQENIIIDEKGCWVHYHHSIHQCMKLKAKSETMLI